ncbi:carbohydrate ABC transporter permease [Elusimicrobiota bacterium]
MRHRPYEPWLYMSPALFFLSVFMILPILILLLLSFYEWDIFAGNGRFIGISNYINMIADTGFHNSIRNTLIYAAGTIIPGIAAALFLAVLVNKKLIGSSFYRTAIFLPVIVSLAAAGTIWLWIYDYQNGFLNFIISKFGLSKVDWLGNPDMALFSIIIVTLWKRIGYNMVIYIAGLQLIPQQEYEAAQIDGADSVAQFRYITWPNLLPATTFIFIINIIYSFRDFTQIYVMTQGGPIGRTTTVVYYIYETAFQDFKIGYAAAVSMLLLLVVLAVTYVKINYFSPEEEKGIL